MSDEVVISRAAAMGVGLVSARRYYLENGYSGEFILGYADLRESEIEAGVKMLATALTN
jgi:GntR family transcriptional regulator / MocR family aminotransferase